MKSKNRKHFVRIILNSLFLSSSALLLVGSLSVLLHKLFPHHHDNFNAILSFNTLLLLIFSFLSLIAVVRKYTVLLMFNLICMLIILLLSSPFLANNPIANFNMPGLQQLSWMLLIVGLVGRFKKNYHPWNRMSLGCFAILGLLMLSLILDNTGTLGSLKFGDTPPASLNTAILMLFSAIAGGTAPSTLNFNCKAYISSLGSWLVLLMSVSTISLWLSFNHQLEDDHKKVAKQTLSNLQQQVDKILEDKTGLIQRLADSISTKDLLDQPQQLSFDFNTYLYSFSDLEYIAALDHTHNISYSAARSKDIKQRNDKYLISTGDVFSNKYAHPNFSFHYFEQTGNTFIKQQLMQPNTLGLSAIIVEIDFQKIMESYLSAILPTGYAITLAYENRQSLLLNQLIPHQQYSSLGNYEINIVNGVKWRLALYRSFDTELNSVQKNSEFILIAGWLACLLILLSLQYQQQIQRQQNYLLAGNKRLRNVLKLQKKLQTQYSQFKDNSGDLLCIVDAHGTFLEVSAASEAMLGYSAQELEGQNFIDFVHPDDVSITIQETELCIKDQNSQYFRNRYLRKDGNIVYLMWSSKYLASNQTIYGVAKDITELVKSEDYQQAQQDILELIATEQPLDAILKRICLMAEEHNPLIKACVMLKVEQHLQIVSAPSLSNDLHLALKSIPIGDKVGSCGTAAFQNKLIITENIISDPNWAQYKDIASAEGLSACWSIPVVLLEGNVLGTFALYCKDTRAPSSEELELLFSCCRFTANAIERSQQKRLLTESEQRFRSLYQFNSDPVYVLDEQGYFLDMNTPGCNLLEWALSELKQMHFSSVVLSKNIAEVSEYFVSALSGSPQNFETTILSRTGTEHELQITIVPTWVDEKIVGVIGIAKDITQRLIIEKQLRLFKRAVDASSNGVIISDITKPDAPIIYVNNGFEKLTGYSQAESLGGNCRFMQGNKRDELASEKIRFAIESKKEISIVLKNYRKDGSAFWNSLFLSPVPDDFGMITHYIGIQTDITEQKRHQDELAFNASHDLLTGLPNRGLLQDRLSKSLHNCSLNKEQVSILFIDLDGFKLINDSLGHLIGDDVICQISHRINKQIRPSDTLARIGGDEFILMLPHYDGVDELNTVVEHLISVISEPLKLNGIEIQLTASIGISVSNNDINLPMELVQQADLAMYQAKRLGRNNAQWYNADMEKTLNKRVSLRAMLKQAMANQEFELYYQPQVEAGSGRLVGLEALLRWKQPDLGFIGPDEFIPVAEEMGLIVELGQWVIEEAAAYNRSLQERGLAEVIMAVNLSSLQFQREGFVEQLAATLIKAQLSPKWFELELTESLLLENFEQVVHKLQLIKELGVNIAIDDFGTGYSSLNYLKCLPLDKLKIDKSFISEIVSDSKDKAITLAIIAMAHQLGLKVIAEGIETISQANLLHENSCDELQGYFFSKPIPADKLDIFLQHYSPITS